MKLPTRFRRPETPDTNMANDEAENYMNGPEAAEFLGVKTATLYAYVSRGLLASEPGENARQRRYRLSELIKLRQSTRGFKSPQIAEEGSWTGPIIKSAITEIREDGHRYRGFDVFNLLKDNMPFEAVTELLWATEKTRWTNLKPFPIPETLKPSINNDSDYLDVLKLLLVSLEINDTVCRKLLAEDTLDTAHRLVVTMATAIGLPHGRSHFMSQAEFPVAQTLLKALTGSTSSEEARLINCVLVLCADHELNASALAARIAASCDASLYSCILSALGSFSGTMHGSASKRAHQLVESSTSFVSAQTFLKDYLRQVDEIPGFGTRLYPTGDPRARYIIDLAQKSAKQNDKLNRLVDIVKCIYDELGLHPNLDIGLTAISYALSLPPGSGSTIFAVSRTAGWIAHAIEQRRYSGIIRPRARYIGRSDADQ